LGLDRRAAVQIKEDLQLPAWVWGARMGRRMGEWGVRQRTDPNGTKIREFWDIYRGFSPLFGDPRGIGTRTPSSNPCDFVERAMADFWKRRNLLWNSLS